MLHELNTIFCPALQDLYVTLLHFWLVLYDVDSIYWPMLHDLYAVFLYALYDPDSGIDKFYINHNPSIVKPAESSAHPHNKRHYNTSPARRVIRAPHNKRKDFPKIIKSP